MGEDIRFARNSQKNIRELIRKQEQAQLELATVLTELHGDAASIVPKNKNLLKKLNTASFAMRELQNNWNSLEFAFQHLMVPQNPPTSTDRSQNSNSQKSDGTKSHVRSGTTTTSTQSTTTTSHVKNENNNLHLKRKTAINCNESQIDMKKEPKLEPKVEPEIEPDDESDDDEDEESEAESAFDPRRSPRIRQNSVRTDSGRSTPIKEQKVPKIKKVRKRKKSNNGEVKSESKSNELISPTLIPKRESLRRVLELSKRTFEDQNNEKDTGDTTGSQSDTSDAESDEDSEPEENGKSTSDEQDNETPKIKLKNVPTPTKIRSETNPKIEFDDEQKVKKERKLKTDPRVLARQRESYHKRKQRRQSNEIIGSGSETNPSSGKHHTLNGGSQPEKGKPWCNVLNRKTPTHILQRRRDAYYRRKEQKLFETNDQSKPSDSPLQPKEEKKKSLKKIEAKPKPTSSLNGAITPIKPITSFVKMTIIPPVYSQSQLETLKSLDQLNQPGLVLLPSPQPQLLNGTITKPKSERSYVKIEKNTKPKNDTPERKFEPPKKRKWDDRMKESSPNLSPGASNPAMTSFKTGTLNSSNEPYVIGSTNGRMPLEKSKNQISNIQTVSGNFKKKIAANWERSLSNSSDTDKDSKIYHPVNPHSEQKNLTNSGQSTTPKSSANHILKNRLTATSEHHGVSPPVSVE